MLVIFASFKVARRAKGGIPEKFAWFFLLPKKKILRKSEIKDSFLWIGGVFRLFLGFLGFFYREIFVEKTKKTGVLAFFVFFCMAAKNWGTTFHSRFYSRKAHNLDNFWQSSLVFLAIWCTSHNFSASLGLWGSFTIQSPAVIFKKDIDKSRYLEAVPWRLIWISPTSDLKTNGTQPLRVKMKCGAKRDFQAEVFFLKDKVASEASCWGIEHIRFPFFLGGARWLVFAKQVYALLLLPYVIPYMVLSYTTAILLAAWSILFTKCCWSLAAKSSDLWFSKKRHWSCRLFGQTISSVEQ